MAGDEVTVGSGGLDAGGEEGGDVELSRVVVGGRGRSGQSPTSPSAIKRQPTDTVAPSRRILALAPVMSLFVQGTDSPYPADGLHS